MKLRTYSLILYIACSMGALYAPIDKQQILKSLETAQGMALCDAWDVAVKLAGKSPGDLRWLNQAALKTFKQSSGGQAPDEYCKMIRAGGGQPTVAPIAGTSQPGGGVVTPAPGTVPTGPLPTPTTNQPAPSIIVPATKPTGPPAPNISSLSPEVQAALQAAGNALHAVMVAATARGGTTINQVGAYLDWAAKQPIAS